MNNTIGSSDTNNSSKNYLSFLAFISLPFIFTIVLNFLLLVNKDNELKTTQNILNHFFDAKIYQNNSIEDTLEAEIIKANNPLFFHDKYHTSKYEETIQNYRNNLSNELELIKKVVPSNDSISLKKINLSNNINERKKDFINILLPIITDQNQKIIVLRQRLIDSKKYLHQNKTLSQTDLFFINDLATKYSVAKKK